MPLTKQQVEHIARLARLNITEKEVEKFSKELALIVDYFKQIASVETEDIEPRDQFITAENVFREDEVKESLPQHKALENAPDSDGEYFHVPKVIG